MNNILSMFDEIEINNNLRVAKEDTVFCEFQESEYKDFIEFSNKYIQYLENNSFENTLYNNHCLINQMITEQEEKMIMFVNKIVNYFKDTYKVTLSNEIIIKKYDINIEYGTIISEIIEQLGGYSFIDKAEKEIKDEFRSTLRQDSVKIKNNKISIERFFCIDQWDVKYKTYSVSYNSDSDFHKLFKAISYFMFKSKESCFDKLYYIITREQNDDVFKTHEISDNGIKALKLYKNGKIDLEFSNSVYTRQFAKEYCE